MSDLTSNDHATCVQQGWVRAPLGRFLTPSVETVDVDPEQSYPTVGVLNRGRGLLYRDPVAGNSTSYGKLNRIGPGVLVYSRLKAFEGAITVTPDDLPQSFASQEFPTFAFASDADPDFFRILTTTQRMWDSLQGASKGMGGRRERVKPDDFLNIVMNVPPLQVQERIVGVIGAVDDQIAALNVEANAVEMAASAIAESMLGDQPVVRVGNHLVRIESGRSPQAVDVPPAEDEEGVLKVSAVVAFQFVAGESKALTPGTQMPKSAEVCAGDVLITRASGAINRVGAVCRVPSGVRGGLYLSDKTLRMVPANGLDPDFLVVAMALSKVRRQIVMTASGSASMKNLSQSKIAGLEVPMPELAEQRKVTSTVLSLRSLAGASRAEADRLSKVRAVLLSGLLNQTIRIDTAELEVA